MKIQSNGIFRSGILVVVMIVFGKGLSFIRDVLISSYFGASTATDAYFAASNIPSIFHYCWHKQKPMTNQGPAGMHFLPTRAS